MRPKLALLTALLTASLGCGLVGDTRCAKAYEKSTQLAGEALADITRKVGGEEPAQRALAEARASAATRRPEVLERCRSALKADPEVTGAMLDCILRADGLMGYLPCTAEAAFKKVF